MTKTFSAAVMMQYEEEGKLSFKDPVIQYPFVSVGFVPQRVDEKVQLRHVLSHTSEGIPGVTFVYHGGRYNFIYGVFERMSGQKYPQAFHQELAKRVFEPLRLESTLAGCPKTNQPTLRARVVMPYSFDAAKGEFRVNRDALNLRVAFPASGLLSTVKDLATYTTALDEHRLVSKSAYERMTAPFINNKGQPTKHGLGWFTESFAGIRLHWSYGYGDSDSAMLLRVPSQKTSLIVLCNSDLPSACARLGSGNPLHSPFAISFLKHFVMDQRLTEPRLDYSGDLARLERGLKKRQREKPHPIHAEELFSQALLKTFIEKKFGGKKGQAGALTRLFYDLNYGAFTNNDPAVFYLLSQHPEAALDGAAKAALDSYLSSGIRHPWILRSIAQRFEAAGNIEEAIRFSHELVDTPGFEEQSDTWDACLFLAEQYAGRREFEKARHYAWRGLIYARQAGGSEAKFMKQIEEINRLAARKI